MSHRNEFGRIVNTVIYSGKNTYFFIKEVMYGKILLIEIQIKTILMLQFAHKSVLEGISVPRSN